jgi:addiction module HigA family antidote
MAADRRDRFEHDWAVAPGEILAEALQERAMPQAELARRTNRPLKTINEIIKGKTAITPETALQLELVLGVSARFWLNLERAYGEHSARAVERERLAREGSWVKGFPLREMTKRGLIPTTRFPADSVQALLRFFAVSSREGWERQWKAMDVTYRRSRAFPISPEALSAWLRAGEIEAEKVECGPFDAANLRAALPRIRAMTRQDPIAFLRPLQRLLAECGIALVLVPELPDTHVSGAAQWLSPTKALIQLSLRHRKDDQFWFALFHEIGHLLGRSRRQIHVDGAEIDTDQEAERSADEFAREALLPVDDWSGFAEAGDFTPGAVRAIAEEMGVSPGIVVGRLQHDRRIPLKNLSYLKREIAWR